MIFLYGGSRTIVERQLACQHRSWTDVCVDFVSLYAKCLDCWTVKRFVSNLNYYYTQVDHYCDVARHPKIAHPFIEHPGSEIVNPLYVSIVIPYPSVPEGKEKALEDMLIRNGIINPKEGFGDKTLRTSASCCGENRQYGNFNSIPLENVKCSCGKTYLLYYASGLDEGNYGDVLAHKAQLVGRNITTSLGGAPVNYENTKTTDDLANNLQEFSKRTLESIQAMANHIDNVTQRIEKIEQRVSREPDNTNKT